MNVAFACPDCAATNQTEVSGDAPVLACSHCGYHQASTPGAVVEGRLRKCLVCPTGELYVRKDFPQRIGVAIVVLGIVGSSITWYLHWSIPSFGILFGSALLDFALYASVGNVLQCYHCHSEYRAVPGLDQYEPFNLEVHERHRQMAARLAESHAPSK